MDLSQIGQFIASLRKERGMTQAELAKILNVTTQAVSKWECGKGSPQASLIVPLADALGVSPAEILSAHKESAHSNEIKSEVVEEIFSNYSRLKEQEKKRRTLKKAKFIIIFFSIIITVILILMMVAKRMYVSVPYGSKRFPTMTISQGSDDSIYMLLHMYPSQKIEHTVIVQSRENHSKVYRTYIHFTVSIWDYLFGNPEYCTNILLVKDAVSTSIDNNSSIEIYYCTSDISKITSKKANNFHNDDSLKLILELGSDE